MGTLRQEVKRLAAELKAMTAERDEYKAEWDKSFELMNKAGDLLKQALAARDALVGAAYEAAAAEALKCTDGCQSCAGTDYSIRALTPADATTALDHMLAQAKAEGRKEGLEEVRSEVATRRTLLNRQMEALDISREDAIYGICDAILAAAQKEEGK